MSLRVAPPASHASATSNTQQTKLTSPSSLDRGAPSAPGLPDTLRLSHSHNAQSSSSPSPLTSTHPLESRLAQWQSTQQQTRATLLRRTFGIALPLRMSMEQAIVRKEDGFRPSVLGPAGKVHDDILGGRDERVEWEDVYAGQDGLRGVVDQGGDGDGDAWRGEMERLVGMGKW